MKRLWLQRGRDAGPTVELNFPACIKQDFPSSFRVAWDAVQQVLAVAARADLSPLAKHSPALRGYDWASYLTCSVVRMTRALETLRARGVTGRLLDYGAYFGNFALMCALAGYEVEAVDGYRALDGALAGCEKLLADAGVRVNDFEDTGYHLTTVPAASYDAALCMGVLEHLAHTPRFVLETLDRVLRPGGMLVLDTPNLAYAYNREKLAKGQSIFCPIEAQYHTDLPFEGHHREYTTAEVRWMLEQIGHEAIEIQTFNYSQFALERLTGRAAEAYREMERDPEKREIILSSSRKPS